MLCFKSRFPYLLQSVVKGCPCNSVFLTPRLDSLSACKKLPIHICPCLQTDLFFCFAYSAQFNQLPSSPTLSRYSVGLRCTLWVLYYFGRYFYRRGIGGRIPDFNQKCPNAQENPRGQIRLKLCRLRLWIFLKMRWKAAERVGFPSTNTKTAQKCDLFPEDSFEKYGDALRNQLNM